MLQHITLDEVKSACREAYPEQRLAAQGPSTSEYFYRADGYGCAIGVALTDKTVELITEPGWTLAIDSKELSECFTWPHSELEQLSKIQSAHDMWQSHVGRATGRGKLKKFQALIAC